MSETRAIPTPAPGIAPSRAATQVFETAELLEMILLELPLRDMFTVQRVSRQYNNTIAGSSKLQQAMWLTPTLDEKDTVLNPLFFKHTFAESPNAQKFSGLTLQFEGSSFSAARELLSYKLGMAPIRQDRKPYWPEPLYSQRRTGEVQTWRKMIVAQNIPSGGLSIILWNSKGRSYEFSWKSGNAEDATMADCFDALDVASRVLEHGQDIGSLSHVRFDMSDLQSTDDVLG